MSKDEWEIRESSAIIFANCLGCLGFMLAKRKRESFVLEAWYRSWQPRFDLFFLLFFFSSFSLLYNYPYVCILCILNDNNNNYYYIPQAFSILKKKIIFLILCGFGLIGPFLKMLHVLVDMVQKRKKKYSIIIIRQSPHSGFKRLWEALGLSDL